MARTEARIKCAIWDDEDFRSLTWQAQWLYKTLLTQKDLSLCGVLTWTPKRFAKLATNADAEMTVQALTLLRERRYVVLDDDTDELWVRTFITGDRVLDNANSIIGMSNAFGAIHSHLIRDAIVQGLGNGFLKGLPNRFPQGLPKGFHDRLGQPFRHALALASTRPPPPAPVPPASCLLPPASPIDGSSSKLNSVGERPAEEEDPDSVTAVCEQVALRRYGKLTDPPPLGFRRDAWLAKTAADVRSRSGTNIPILLTTQTVEAIVDLFEPPDRPATVAQLYPAAGQLAEPVWDLDDQGAAVARVAP